MLYNSPIFQISRMEDGQAENDQAEAPGKKRRLVRAVTSTSAIDAHGSIILTEGLDLERYLQNPVMLWNHGRDWLPIGRALEIKKQPNRLEGLFELADTEAGREVYQLFEQKILRGFSVGGRILEVADVWQPESEWGELPDFARSALREKKCQMVIRKMEVHEISVCAIPSNPQTYGEVLRSEARLEAKLDAIGRQLETLLARTAPDQADDQAEAPDQNQGLGEAAEIDQAAETQPDQAEPEITLDQAEKLIRSLIFDLKR